MNQASGSPSAHASPRLYYCHNTWTPTLNFILTVVVVAFFLFYFMIIGTRSACRGGNSIKSCTINVYMSRKLNVNSFHSSRSCLVLFFLAPRSNRLGFFLWAIFFSRLLHVTKMASLWWMVPGRHIAQRTASNIVYAARAQRKKMWCKCF